MKSEPQPVYLVCGVPGSGKTWVCEQLEDRFNYVPHDDYLVSQYGSILAKRAMHSDRPVLAEAPFRISVLIQELKKEGIQVIPFWIIESSSTVKKRYESREKKPIPKMHLTRIDTVKKRANDFGGYQGTSTQILDVIKQLSATH